MGEHLVRGATSTDEIRAFTRAMLRDLDALERMLREGRFETGARRYGAEQEMFLVDADARPAPVAPELLKRSEDERLTTELARFNLEANLPPGELTPTFLDELRSELDGVLSSVTTLAASQGAMPLLTGTLPTLHGADFGPHNMTPSPRYEQLNANILALRGGEISVFIRGVDQIHRHQGDVMLESANASLQLHLQVDADAFVERYNRAQLITPPLLAVAASSPLLMGRRLWHETRIALFELATDVRSAAQLARGKRPRVGFGKGWIRDSVLEIFRADVMGFRVLLTRDPGPDPIGELDAGRPPGLRALTLHNGTVWRWNRACYGITEGKPHLRIENRVLPSGPTVADEVANAALFYGLMAAPADRFGDVTRLDFTHLQANFLAAARHGIEAPMRWFGGEGTSARELLGRHLLPAAREGLAELGLDSAAVTRALEPIEERVDRGINGSTWMLDAFNRLIERGRREWATQRLTEALMERQQSGEPVHTWAPLHIDRTSHSALEVRHVMMPEVETLHPEDAIEIAERIHEWNDVDHVVVEADGEVVGLVRRGFDKPEKDDVTVGDVMEPNPPCIVPDLSLQEARRALEERAVDCLLVVSDGRVIGVVTKRELA